MRKEDWLELVTRFVSNDMPAPDFEHAFIAAYREVAEHGESIPFAMDLLFSEVDAYQADAALRGPMDIDDAQLREAAARLLVRIDEPWPPLAGVDDARMTPMESLNGRD